MMVAMVEGTDKSTPKHEDAARKRMRRSGSLQREQQSKARTRRELGAMTVRNWLPIVSALLVPLVIAFGIWQITWQLEKLENQRAQQAQKLENQRAEAERELAEQRAQDEALQAYLDQMSHLILDRKLLEVEQGDPVHTLAQARTSTVILRLDAEHNESVIRFLSDSGLAGSDESSDSLLSKITLKQAALSDADLSQADLSDADLSGVHLSKAHVNSSDLSGTRLHSAILRESDLSGADLSDANLIDADLSNTSL